MYDTGTLIYKLFNIYYAYNGEINPVLDVSIC